MYFLSVLDIHIIIPVYLLMISVVISGTVSILFVELLYKMLLLLQSVSYLLVCCNNCQDPNDLQQQQNGGMMRGGPRGGMRGRGGRGMPRGGPMMGRGGGSSQMMGGSGGRPPMRWVLVDIFFLMYHHIAVFTTWCIIMQSMVLWSHVICLTLVDHDHIGWKSWKLIAWTISPTSLLFVG